MGPAEKDEGLAVVASPLLLVLAEGYLGWPSSFGAGSGCDAGAG